MLKYILGFFKFFFLRRISKTSLITPDSKISKKSRVYRFSKIYSSSINDYSYLGVGSELVYAHVEKYCSIAQNCSIGLASHTINNISTSPIFTEKKNATSFSWIEKDLVNHKQNNVEIGNDVWIGKNVTILSNVKIGNGAIIGTGAIVTKDVPDYAIVAGIPAKIIRYRFSEEVIDKLLEIKWWNLPENVLKKNIHLFQKENVSIEDLSPFSYKEK